MVQRLPGMREVPGSNPLGGNNLCSPSPLEETLNRGPNSPIHTMHALICEELKDPSIPPKKLFVSWYGLSFTSVILLFRLP